LLVLKESNSPYWLIGASKGKTLAGSSTNIPCYFKSIKKQKELATQIFKNNNTIDEVYALTGIQWDNMPTGAKEEYGYIKNKGKLILSKDEITEGDYPKGISRDPLPKKGVKTYTSAATALEGKEGEKMKLELNKEKFIKEDIDDIPEILQDRFFNVMADGRPEEFKKFTKTELKQFAEFVKELPSNEVTELERSLLLYAISMAHGDDLTVESITESTQDLIDKYEIDVDSLKSDGYDLIVFRCPECAEDLKEYNPYVYDDGTEIPLEKIKVIEVEEHNTDCENAEDNMYEDPQKMAPIQLYKYSKIDIVKESKIVTPVGNPQMASSFVNIDVDLDHMEVSDFIVRLAQAIRSEQTSVLEYVALRSANGITNEERANIDAIIEEEKNHMVAFTTMLYKQLLTNHKQNVDGANAEFTLPTFGNEIFDNSEEGKLTESIASTVEKLAIKETSIRMSDEYFIGNNEDGRMYHGLGSAMNAIKNVITTSGEQVMIQNVTIADSKNESIKLEDTFNSIDELVNELKTDTNYDEIALHIHAYAKTNKARASELMDKLFELERSKSPKECRDALIADLENENKQYKTEDTNITGVSSTMSQDQYEIEVDVNYDIDCTIKLGSLLEKTIKAMNPETAKNQYYAIAEDNFTLGEKFKFTLLIFNNFYKDGKEVTKEFVAGVIDTLFDRTSTYECFIERV